MEAMHAPSEHVKLFDKYQSLVTREVLFYADKIHLLNAVLI